MRAGLLTDTILILEAQTVKSDTGAVKTVWNETRKIKAYRKKTSQYVGDGQNASEQFIENTLIFQIRKYSFINENIRIKYKDKIYRVTLLDPHDHPINNSYLMTCTKVNE